MAALSVGIVKSKLSVAPKNKRAAEKILRDLHISIGGQDAQAVSQSVNNLDNVLGKIIDELPKSSFDAVNISHMRDAGDVGAYIYRHSLSVAVISMVIGRSMGLPVSEVAQLGKCAAMHDIGNFMVPIDILQKPGRLDDDEFDKIKKHTLYGYNFLINNKLAEKNVCRGILLHHEKCDGTGYPLSLAAAKIPLWSKIIAAADTYDAMTSVRPHRQAFSVAETCDHLLENAGKAFDEKVVRALLRRIEFYPAGTCVQLSNGRIALVTDTVRSKMRPVVRLIETGKILDLRGSGLAVKHSVSLDEVIKMGLLSK